MPLSSIIVNVVVILNFHSQSLTSIITVHQISKYVSISLTHTHLWQKAAKVYSKAACPSYHPTSSISAW